MNSDDILDMIGDAKGTYVWDAQEVRSGAIPAVTKRKMPIKKILLIAAAIALLAATITACAYVIQRMKMNLVQHNVPTQTEPVGTDVVNNEDTQPINVLTDCYPQAIPEGYEILCGSPLDYNSRNIDYRNSNGNTIIFWISTKAANESVVLRPPVEESTVNLSCGEVILRKNESAQVIEWSIAEDGYWASLFTDDMNVDLASIADSVGYGEAIPVSVWYHQGQEWNPWIPQALP